VELKLSKQGAAVLENSPDSIQKRLMEAVAAMQERERQSLVAGLQTLIQKAGLQEEEPSLFFEDGRTRKYEGKTR